MSVTDIDIPALIERLRERARQTEDAGFEQTTLYWKAAEALSRLAVSPLPEEIAGLAYALRVPGWIPDEEKEKAAAALEQMARAYEVLKNDCAECFAQNEQYAARIRELEAERDLMEEIGVKHATLKHEALERIRDIEAERDRCRETNTVLMGQWEDACGERDKLKQELAVAVRFHERDAKDYEALLDERDAIKAKTIEECLSVIPGGNICDPQTIADSIRALMPAGDGKENP